MRLLPSLLVFACLIGPATAQPVKLGTDWDATFEEAKQRNVPVIFLLGRDGKTPWTSWFKTPATASYLADRVLILIAHRGGEHKPVKQVDPKTKAETEVCPLYSQLTCEVHKGFYDDKAGHFDYEELPAGFLLRPDGSKALDKIESLPAKMLMKKVDEIQFALGEGVFASEIAKLEKKLKKGDGYLAKDKFKAARKIYEKPLKQELKKHLKTIVDARLEALDKGALAAIEAAKGLEPKARHETLKRIAREMKDRGPCEVAEKVLAELEAGG